MIAIFISIALFFALGLMVIETKGSIFERLTRLLIMLYVIVLIGISVFIVYSVFKILCCIATII